MAVSQQLQSLLDTTSAFDENRVKLLDEAISTLYGGSSDENRRRQVDAVLTQLQTHPESWRLVQTILTHSKQETTHFYAIGILQQAVRTRWKILPLAERQSIPKYLIHLSVTATLSPNSNQALRTKINEVVVDVASRTWPKDWPTFIFDLCQAAHQDQKVCENNLQILTLLSENILDFGADEMTSQKCRQLSAKLKDEFVLISDLCLFVLTKYHENPKSVTPSLVQTTLVCLSSFIRWNPPNHIFDVNLPNVLMDHFWDPVEYRTNCVKCMSEVFGDFQLEDSSVQVLTKSWITFLSKCNGLPPQSFEYTTKVPSNTRVHWESLFQLLTVACTQFARAHFTDICEVNHPAAKSALMELNVQPVELALNTLEFILRLTKLPSEETFKICLEFWNEFAQLLYDANKTQLGNSNQLLLYNPVLNEIRALIVRRMARPPEVYIIYNEEDGTVERDYQPDTDEIAAYNSMKSTLVLLTQLGGNETESLMLNILNKFTEAAQRDSSQKDWNPTLLNRLCWAIGSISGSLAPERERAFLILLLKQLLWFCEIKRGKENKAIIASCIMYVNGQYPRFLQQNSTLLRVVVMKNFEFMEDTFPGVQDMACETFFKISKGCAQTLAILVNENGESFLEATLGNLTILVSRLQSIKQKIIVFHAIAVIISEAPSHERHRLLHILTEDLNTSWKQSISVVAGAIRDNKKIDLPVLRTITEILQINERIADAAGVSYDVQFVQLFPEILQLYQLYSFHFQRLIQMGYGMLLNDADSREMRSTRKISLRVIDVFINRSSQGNTNTRQIVVQKVIPPLLSFVYIEYRDSQPIARDPEVLNLSGSLIDKLDKEIISHFPAMFLPIFQPTLEMINKDFESYPELRLAFYQFLRKTIYKCYEALLSLGSDVIKSVVAALIFGMQDEKPDVAALALKTLLHFLRKNREMPGDGFWPQETDYSMLLQQTMGVLTDTLHTAGFRDQCSILQELASWAGNSSLGARNFLLKKEEIMSQMGQILIEAFPNLNPKQVLCFVYKVFGASDIPIDDFCQHVKDFLVQLKEYGGDDSTLEL